MKKVFACLLVAVLVFSTVVVSDAKGNALTFRTTDIKGNTVTESIFDGYNVILINEWATWCGPCVREMPEIEKQYEAYKDVGILVIGAVTDSNESDIQSTLKETGVTYPIINFCSAFNPYTSEPYIPASFFVDGEGQVIDIFDILVKAEMPAARADAAYYKQGGYNQYINDPAYAEYKEMFDLLKAAAEGGENELIALAEYYAKRSTYNSRTTIYGSLSGEVWQIIFLELYNQYCKSADMVPADSFLYF